MGKIQVIRKKEIKKKHDPLKFQRKIWLIGHCMTLGFGLLFTISYIFHIALFFKYRNWKWLFLRLNKNYNFIGGNRWYHSILRSFPSLLYRLSLLGSIISMNVTTFQNWERINPQWYEMLSAENFQMLLVAILWTFVGRRSIYRLIPYMVLSYIHLSNREAEFNKPLSENEDSEDTVVLLKVIAYSELICLFALVMDCILLKDGTSGICLVVYFGLYWLRLNFSPYARATVHDILQRLDKEIPPEYQPQWTKFKRFLQFKEETHSEKRERIEKTA